MKGEQGDAARGRGARGDDAHPAPRPTADAPKGRSHCRTLHVEPLPDTERDLVPACHCVSEVLTRRETSWSVTGSSQLRRSDDVETKRHHVEERHCCVRGQRPHVVENGEVPDNDQGCLCASVSPSHNSASRHSQTPVHDSGALCHPVTQTGRRHRAMRSPSRPRNTSAPLGAEVNARRAG